MTQNWRQEVDAGDYFGHQRKQLTLADRRPVIRRGSDLVGPGIGASAVRITDYNDILALYNGYYSSDVGGSGAPNSTDRFIGYVVMDDEFGGEQVFRSMTTGIQYVRLARRNPADPTSITWTDWVEGA